MYPILRLYPKLIKEPLLGQLLLEILDFFSVVDFNQVGVISS